MNTAALENRLEALQAEWDVCDCHDTLMDLEDEIAEIEAQLAADTSETFDRSKFTYDGMYLHYIRADGSRAFIARFKYSAQKKRRLPMIRALVGKPVQSFLDLAAATSPYHAAQAFGEV